jgi:predicted nucleic-acid-binding protein
VIGLDTNILLRAIVGDDAGQEKRARAFLSEQCTQANPGFVNLIVLSELVWTLDKSYGFSRTEIAETIEALLMTTELSFEMRDDVVAALPVFRKSNAGFADILIETINRARGCEVTATFDRKAAKLDGFRLL